MAPGASALMSNGASPLTLNPTSQVGADFGATHATGDINGDGYADALVGADRYNAGAASEGRVYVYMGSASGLADSAALTLDPTSQANSQFGLNVALGDINGDGYADAVIGASGYSANVANEGRVYVYMGSASGLADSAALTLDPTDQDASSFGGNINLGDINNDGYADAVIGAIFYSANVASEGRVYVYMGSASGLADSAALTLDPTDQGYALFGAGSIPISDINGDGYGDVIIAALGYSANVASEGRVYVYMGSASGLADSAALTLDPADQANSLFGVASSGDFNNDGYADAVIAAPYYNAGAAGEGRAYVYMGSALGLANTPVFAIDPTSQADANFGLGNYTGDLNGDGYFDAILGAPGYNAGAAGEGRAYVYMGSALGLANTPALTLDPTSQAGAQFGYNVMMGDFNGDSYHDALIGAPLYNAAAIDEGRTYIYYGSVDSLAYQDADHDGAVENIRWTMDENVTACTFVAENWDVASAGTIGVSAITGLTCTGADNILDITVTSGAGKTGGSVAPVLAYEYASGSHIILASGNLGTFPNLSVSDAAAPVMVSVSPASAAANVPLADPIAVTFSEAMAGPGTGCTFVSSPDPGGYAMISSAANWSNGDKTVTLSHGSYRRGILVTVTLAGCAAAAGSVTVLAANSGVPNPWSFMTISGISPGGGGAPVAVAQPSLVVSIPVSGTVLSGDSTVGVSWSSADGAFVRYRVSYSADNGTTWTVLTDNAANTSYSWTVPQQSAAQGLIKVEGLASDGAVLASGSSGAFAVVGSVATPLPPAAATAPASDPTVDGFYTAAEAKANNPTIADDKGITPATNPVCEANSLVKGSLPAVYWCGADSKRYVFPNERVYFTWYEDFLEVKVITDADLSQIPMGSNVTYRPGTKLVKAQTDPRVYAVARGGILRWVPNEETAAALYGPDWNKNIDYIPDPFLVNYRAGKSI